MHLWLLSYIEDGLSNTLRLAVASGQAGFEADSWYYYDFNPQQLGFPAGTWFDYPRLARTANSLYLTANVFRANMGPWQGTAILRLPLAPIAAGTLFNYQYYVSPDHF